MLKNRLIFTLLYDDGNYMLSRNFRLQKVGNLKWLKHAYNLNAIACSIDELVVLNVGRGDKNMRKFASDLSDLVCECFVPVAAGGGIRSLDDGYLLMRSGADKLIVNTITYDKPTVVKKLIKTFGSQSVVASIDCKKDVNDYKVFKNNGSVDSGLLVQEVVKRVEKMGVGELYVTSIDRDGIGEGLDLKLVRTVSSSTNLPVIVAGGIGKFEHFLEGMKKGNVKTAATANIYNFMADGLMKARNYLKDSSIPLAVRDHRLESLRGFFHKRI